MGCQHFQHSLHVNQSKLLEKDYSGKGACMRIGRAAMVWVLQMWLQWCHSILVPTVTPSTMCLSQVWSDTVCNPHGRFVKPLIECIHPPYSFFACWSLMVRVLLCGRHPGLVLVFCPRGIYKSSLRFDGNRCVYWKKSLTFLNEVSISVLSTRKKSELRSIGGVTRELCTADKVCEPDVVIYTWSPR